ncbi:MAG: ABC transporter substrate-binding (seleno)protein SaoB [Syntrophobacteraceae bacterium]
MKGGVAAFALLSLVMGAAVGLLSIRSGKPDPSKIRIGAPDDSGGLILHYIRYVGGFEAAEVVEAFQTYTLKDCCAGASEWALSADMLDMAIMCPDAAKRLIEKDARYKITGPVLLNSDVLVIRSWTKPPRIGIAHKRQYQEKLVKERFPGGCTTVPMLPAGLPHALERGGVDGVVLDILKASAVSGERLPCTVNGADLVTYILVIRKDFRKSLLYGQFMKSFEQAAADLGDTETLARAVERYKRIRWTDREMEEWKALRVRFVSPLKAGD